MQLRGLGWTYRHGDLDYPAKTDREHFREVLLKPRLRAAIRCLNRDPHGREYLDDLTLDRAIRELERSDAHDPIQRNRDLTDHMVRGIRVPWAVKPPWAHEDDARLRFLDFDRPAHNDFLAINQFRVDYRGRTGFVIPDIVLFINGIPLVVIECKSPAVVEPMMAGITQLLRYSNQRQDVADPEGVPHLFHFNQFLISTWFYEARAAALGAPYEHYQEWKDTHPVPRSTVVTELGKAEAHLKSQELLAAGLLRPAHLLDILQNFILFSEDSGRLIKLIPRYQQFRAVHKAVERLSEGRPRRESHDLDQRGGVIWHTQGSGKSITMVYLVRKLRTVPALRDFKVVLVTDRTQLEKQLRETMSLSG